MTRDEIMKMPPGRELDSWIAEKVLGLIKDDVDRNLFKAVPRRYSTDISAAWDVLRHLKGYHIELVRHRGLWTAALDDGKRSFVVRANSAPEAICKAALLAVLDGEDEGRMKMNAIDRDDTAQKIAEIREALDAATPGPWENVRLFYVGVTTEGRFYPVAECDDQNNAILIANAPEWLGFLLSELERKDEVIEEQKRQLFYKSQEITELREKSWQDQQWFKQASANMTEMQKEFDREREESRKLREERDKLVECLRFYERMARGREANDGGRSEF